MFLNLLSEGELEFDYKEKKLVNSRGGLFNTGIFGEEGNVHNITVTLISVLCFIFGIPAAFHQGIEWAFIFLIPCSGLVWLSNSLIQSELKEINQNYDPPAHHLEDFYRWEIGDKIETDHFTGKFKGVTEHNRVVLEFYTCKLEDNEVIALPSLYLSKYLRQNEGLENRIKSNTVKNLLNNAEESKYMKAYKRELEKLQSDSTSTDSSDSVDPEVEKAFEKARRDLDLKNG